MDPIIENDHPDAISTREFRRDGNNPRVKLVEMAYSHIVDISENIQRKFGQNILIDCWLNAVDSSDEEFLELFDKEFIKPCIKKDDLPWIESL